MFDAVDFGVTAAVAGDLLDQTRPIVVQEVHIHPEEKPPPVLINAADGTDFSISWQTFIGQESVKQELMTWIAAAKEQDCALEHVLLASGYPGVGKTTLSEIVAREMGGRYIKLVPPFALETLHEAARGLPDKGVLFIDEIHKLADVGPRGPESLLHLLEERRLYTDEGMIPLNDITVIGATTARDRLPETIVTRFTIKPNFEPYDEFDLTRIVAGFADDEGITLSIPTMQTLAMAAQGTPRRARHLVKAAHALSITLGQPPTGQQVLKFQRVDRDGMEQFHRDYLTTLYRHFPRQKDGQTEYVAGEMALVTALRETKTGLARIERFLIERGMLDRTPSGRQLTAKGIARAQTILRRAQQ